MHRARFILLLWLALVFGVWLMWSVMTGGSIDSLDRLGWAGIWILICGGVAGLAAAVASWMALPRTAEEEAPTVARREAPPTRRELSEERRKKRPVETTTIPPEWKYRCSQCQRTIHRYARICPHCRARLR